MKKILSTLLISLLLTGCAKAPAVQTESRVIQTIPAVTTTTTTTTTAAITTTAATTTTTVAVTEPPTEEPSMQSSVRVGNYYFLDINDGFEFCVPGPAGYDLLHVFHYNKDGTLKELDYVVIPNEDFDNSILIGKSYRITSSGHYIFAFTSGSLFDEASKLSMQENRDKAWELWNTEVKE